MFGATELTDATVAAAASGSRTDLSNILETVAPQVRLMVIARLSPTGSQLDVVEDIAQRTMVALAQNLSRLEHRTVAGLRSYLSGIVSRKVADYLRGGAAGPGPQARSLDTAVTDFSRAAPLWQFLSASGMSPQSAAEQSEQVGIVMSALGRLKDQYREAIALAFFDQMSTREIAGRLGMTRPAASMLLIRAIKALRQRVADLSGTVDRHET